MIFDMFNDNDTAIIMMFLSDVPGTVFVLPQYHQYISSITASLLILYSSCHCYNLTWEQRSVIVLLHTCIKLCFW